MNIKQASEQSGVSAPNIRFYEKEGLLTPARRQGNDYRDYTAGDVRTLKLIRMLRMLDVPLPTIRAVLHGEQPLQQALQAQQTVLEQQAAQLAAPPRSRGSSPAGCRITARWRRCSTRSTFSLFRRAASTPRRSLRRLCRPMQRKRRCSSP